MRSSLFRAGLLLVNISVVSACSDETRSRAPADGGTPSTTISPDGDKDGSGAADLPACDLPFAGRGGKKALPGAVTLIAPIGNQAYGIAWTHRGTSSSPTAMVATIGHDGSLIEGPTSAAPGIAVGLVWNGDGFGLMIHQDSSKANLHDVSFVVLDAKGVAKGAPVVVSNRSTAGGPTGSSLAWSGSTYLIGWVEFDGQTPVPYVRRIDAAGKLLGSSQMLPKSTILNYGFPSNVVWTGSLFALAWNTALADEIAIVFYRDDGAVDAEPTKVAGDIEPTGVNHYAVPTLHVARNDGDGGNKVAVTWLNAAESPIPGKEAATRVAMRAVLLSSSGELVRGATTIATPFISSMSASTGRTSSGVAYGGNDYLISMDTGNEDTPTSGDVFATSHVLARVGLDGAPLEEPVVIDVARPDFDPTVVWNGREYATAWREGADANVQGFFVRAGMCP